MLRNLLLAAMFAFIACVAVMVLILGGCRESPRASVPAPGYASE